jgi:hypothetical protein
MDVRGIFGFEVGILLTGLWPGWSAKFFFILAAGLLGEDSKAVMPLYKPATPERFDRWRALWLFLCLRTSFGGDRRPEIYSIRNTQEETNQWTLLN